MCELTKAGDKTHLQLTYTVAGYLASGLGATMAKPVDDVLTRQVQRLKNGPADEAVIAVVVALEAAEIPYKIVGSLASNSHKACPSRHGRAWNRP